MARGAQLGSAATMVGVRYDVSSRALRESSWRKEPRESARSILSDFFEFELWNCDCLEAERNMSNEVIWEALGDAGDEPRVTGVYYFQFC